jgi:hypothetical protein
MKPEKLICNSSNITYDKGYIALWCKDYDLPDTVEIDDDTLLKKDHFHVSLLCVNNILETKSDIEEEIIQHFCDFTQENEIEFNGFTKEFRLATREERKSVVAMCKVSNLEAFAEYLTEKIGFSVAPQPTHVTIYTLQHNMGIGLNSPEELEEKSKPIEMPDPVKEIL